MYFFGYRKKSDQEDKEQDKVSKNFLVDNISSDENDGKSEEESVQSCKGNNQKNNKTGGQEIPKLPPPVLDSKVTSSINAASSQDSVFVSHFQKEEAAKLSILQKHVKVTEIEKRNEIGGKKICWNYRKGKCRKGHRCAFAHDNDIPLPTSEEDFNEGDKQPQSSVQLGSGYFSHFTEHHTPVDLKDDDSYMSNLKRKKKYGVNDNLVPPKKALKDLHEQRSKERPWTVNQ